MGAQPLGWRTGLGRVWPSAPLPPGRPRGAGAQVVVAGVGHVAQLAGAVLSAAAGATTTTTTTSGFEVTVNPTLKQVPGSTALGTLVNGIAGWALMLALAGLLIGAAMWALGSHSQNYQQSYVGKRAVLVSALAALVIGVAPVLINFFFKLGTAIPNPIP